MTWRGAEINLGVRPPAIANPDVRHSAPFLPTENACAAGEIARRPAAPGIDDVMARVAGRPDISPVAPDVARGVGRFTRESLKGGAAPTPPLSRFSNGASNASLNVKRNARPFGAIVTMFLGLALNASGTPVFARDSAPGLLLESYKLPITPPKDQGDSELCWAFATLSMLETNYLSRHPGANVEFSRGALQRASIVDRFERWLRGESRHLEDGGLAVDALDLIRAQGLVAAPDFHDIVESDPIFDSVAQRLDALPDATARRRVAEDAIKRGLGDPAPVTKVGGVAMTPAALAKAALGDETWIEYDLSPDGLERVGPSTDPDARPQTRVHYVALAKMIDLIKSSLRRREAVVWGSTDNHALLIFGADYGMDGRPLAYWVKDTFAPYVYREAADDLHKELTDVTVSRPPLTETRAAAEAPAGAQN
jgi:hypothetical protein